jgi:dipeptidyl aminopeptidase/acylaminoacyl peptidase
VVTQTDIKSKSNFDLRKLASIPNFYFPKLNYSNDTIAFYWDKTGRLELYTMDLATREIIQITDGELPRAIRSDYIWSRDSSKIIFTKDKEGDENHDFYEIDISQKEVNQITDTPRFEEHIIHSSPDGKWYTANSNRNGQMNVYRMSSNGSEFQQITAHENPADGGHFSPDGSLIAYSGNEEANFRNRDIYLAKPDGSWAERVVQIKSGSQDFFADWANDGKSFAFTTDASGTDQPAIYHVESKEIRYFGGGKRNEAAQRLTKDGKYLICLRTKDASVYPVTYEIETGNRREFTFPPGVAAGSELLDDRYLFVTLNTPTTPSSLVKIDILEGEMETLLETDFGEIDANLIVDSEHFYYESLDRTKIPAIIYKPRDFDPNLKYPGIVVPHGGPTWQYFLMFSMMAQYLVDLGYVALFPNARGSIGYGVEFRDACLKDWGGKDHDDWVAGRQWIIDNASVDPDRVAVLGGSYGGYATLVCVTKSPDLWKTGIAWIPVSHLGNMYERSKEHFKYFLKTQMGDPVQFKDLWEERSPLNYVDNIRSSLMLIHGANDPRCPVQESRNVRDRLQELGKNEGKDGEFEYVEWADEGHGSYSDINGRIRTLELIEDFLSRRL